MGQPRRDARPGQRRRRADAGRGPGDRPEPFGGLPGREQIGLRVELRPEHRRHVVEQMPERGLIVAAGGGGLRLLEELALRVEHRAAGLERRRDRAAEPAQHLDRIHARQKLRQEAADAAARGSLPDSADAARFYSEGLERLRAFDTLAARELLRSAVAAAPG